VTPAQIKATSSGPKAEVRPDQFDLQTHQFDKRGNLKSTNHYFLHIRGTAKYFERPQFSGNLFTENDEPAGRVERLIDEKTGKTVLSFDHSVEHKQYAPPLEGAEKIHHELAETKAENAALLAELEALRAEKDAKEAAIEAKGEAGRREVKESPLAQAQVPMGAKAAEATKG